MPSPCSVSKTHPRDGFQSTPLIQTLTPNPLNPNPVGRPLDATLHYAAASRFPMSGAMLWVQRLLVISRRGQAPYKAGRAHPVSGARTRCCMPFSCSKVVCSSSHQFPPTGTPAPVLGRPVACRVGDRPVVPGTAVSGWAMMKSFINKMFFHKENCSNRRLPRWGPPCFSRGGCQQLGLCIV